MQYMIMLEMLEISGDLMCPDRVIAPQSSNKVLTSAFLINFKLQYLCKDVSDYHNSLTIFDQHFNALSDCVS